MVEKKRCPECGGLIAKEGQERPDFRSASYSTIARNPELANFLLDCAVTMTFLDSYHLAKARFGEVVPSRSSVYRFFASVRNIQHG